MMQDGTELCRLAGLLTRGKVPEDIIYRTNNIRSVPQVQGLHTFCCSNFSLRELQQKNVALFLQIVDEEINKKHKRSINFGPRKEKALGNFENFHAVLKGLSELSKFFARGKERDLKSFKVVGKSSENSSDIDLDLDYYTEDYGMQLRK